MQPPAELNTVTSHGHSPRQPRAQGKNQIVLVGASVRAAAQSAKRAGWIVTGIDLFGDSDTVAACDRYFAIDATTCWDELFAACRGIPAIQVGGLDGHQPLIRQFMANCPSPGGGEEGDRLREIGYLRKTAAAAGMRFPPTLDLSQFHRSKPAGRWLRKRRQSCGGLGVHWHQDGCNGQEELGQKELEGTELGPRELGDIVIQKWIPGRVYGATLLCDGRQPQLLGVCRSLFRRRRGSSDGMVAPFLYCGSAGPVGITSDISQRLRRLGRQIVATTNYRGPLNIDFLLDRGGAAWLLEVNPRWSGSSELIERKLIDQKRIADHQSLLGLMISAMEGREMEGIDVRVAANESPIYLKRIVMARREMRFESPPPGWLRADESIHDVPSAGTVIRRGAPVCTLIRRIEADVQDPMHRHRVLIRVLSGAASCHSPRASA